MLYCWFSSGHMGTTVLGQTWNTSFIGLLSQLSITISGLPAPGRPLTPFGPAPGYKHKVNLFQWFQMLFAKPTLFMPIFSHNLYQIQFTARHSMCVWNVFTDSDVCLFHKINQLHHFFLFIRCSYPSFPGSYFPIYGGIEARGQLEEGIAILHLTAGEEQGAAHSLSSLFHYSKKTTLFCMETNVCSR